MRKIFMGVAVVSLIMASCANEELVGNNDDGKVFELKVSQGLESRTTLEFDKEHEIYQTLWSEGDQIYVTSEDGKTEGVLTLDSRCVGSTVGTFRGYIFGDGELTKAVFPVPSNKVVSLSKISADETDAPMVGTISGQSTTLVNQAAIIKLNIIDLPENSTLTISGDNIISSATWNGSTLVNASADNIVVTGADALDNIYIPVFVKNNAETTTLNVKVGNGDALTLTNIAIEKEKISVNVPVLVYNNGTLVRATDEGDNVQVVTPGENAIQTLNNFAGTENAVIWVEAGEYASFKLTNVAKGVTIICEEGTTFKGTSNLNINGSTVIGAVFSNEEGGIIYQSSVKGRFVNCKFEGKNGLYYGYATDVVEFENCEFTSDDYTFHFDDCSNGYEETSKIICRECVFNAGWRVAIGGGVASTQMEDCVFNVRGFINTYYNVTYTRCSFSDSEYGLRCLGGVGTYNSCIYDGRNLTIGDIELFENYSCTVIIDGKTYVEPEE